MMNERERIKREPSRQPWTQSQSSTHIGTLGTRTAKLRNAAGSSTTWSQRPRFWHFTSTLRTECGMPFGPGVNLTTSRLCSPRSRRTERERPFGAAFRSQRFGKCSPETSGSHWPLALN
jgi:hypothetical protein